MKTRLVLISLIAALVINFVPSKVFASSASVYASPSSSSVARGNQFTVQVRVNSGSNLMDSVQATLNFDSSKLQYVSYSGGNFTTFSASSSASSFSYVGTILGGSTSSDKNMFSVTLKAINPGTASLSVSGAAVAYQGAAFSSVGASGGSVSIVNPSSGGSGGGGGGGSNTSSPSSGGSSTDSGSATYSEPNTEEAKDTTPPKLKGKPELKVSQDSITIIFKTDEPAKLRTTYKLKDDSKSLTTEKLSSEHTVIIGKDQPLIPGTTYAVSITAEDADGNKAQIFKDGIRTTGVEYRVKIVDLEGNPLTNHLVKLFSDPIETTTDSDGLATFNDVTPGKHTLVFEVDGLVLRMPVQVGQALSLAEDGDIEEIKLPVRFASIDQVSDSSHGGINGPLVLGALLLGALLSKLIKPSHIKKVKSLFSKLPKPQSN